MTECVVKSQTQYFFRISETNGVTVNAFRRLQAIQVVVVQKENLVDNNDLSLN